MKRIISLLLVLIMLVSAFALASCSDQEEEKNPTPNKDYTDNGGNAAIMEGDIFAERAAVDDELPEADYDGREFRVVGYSRGEYYVAEEDRNKGDLIKDAKHKRNTLVEERYDVKITPTYWGTYMEVNDWVSKSVLSGVDEFDLLINHSVDSGALVLKNLFLNWYDIPHIDFSKPWWAKSTSEDLTYDGKCILAVSDLNTQAIGCTMIMVFNKNLANAYDLGNIYDVVFEGDWTYDYFYELIKDIYRDDDGSGDRTIGDFYGFATGLYSINNFLYGFDHPIVDKDDDGVPQIVLKSDRINNIISTMYDFCYNTQGSYYDPVEQNVNNFIEGKSIFAISSLGGLLGEGMRNFEDEYGVLPFPKWNENQKEYYTTVSGDLTVSAVPKTVKDTEFVGLITEALSAESYKHVTPTYYEIALKTRYLRDNESKKVLDILLDGRIYDFGYIYNGWKATLADPISKLMRDGASNFESFYQKNYPASRLQYKDVLKAFNRLG